MWQQDLEADFLSENQAFTLNEDSLILKKKNFIADKQKEDNFKPYKHLIEDDWTYLSLNLHANEAMLGDLINQVEDKGRLPLLYYSASWCGPCQLFTDTLKKEERLRNKLASYTFISIDVGMSSDCVNRLYLHERLICNEEDRISVRTIPAFAKIDKEFRQHNLLIGNVVKFLKDEKAFEQFKTFIQESDVSYFYDSTDKNWESRIFSK